MYNFHAMLSDMRQDFAKYVELYPNSAKCKFPIKIDVLLRSPSLYVICGYRLLFWLKTRKEVSRNPLPKLGFRIFGWLFKKYANIVTKIDISNWPEIGPGLYLSNQGGIIMGPKRIGSGCVVHHNVTIGMDRKKVHPIIGNRVWIGPDSLIYGQTVSDGVIVKRRTVVGKNVPARVIIKGNPGVIVKRDIDNSRLLNCSNPDPLDIEQTL